MSDSEEILGNNNSDSVDIFYTNGKLIIEILSSDHPTISNLQSADNYTKYKVIEALKEIGREQMERNNNENS